MAIVPPLSGAKIKNFATAIAFVNWRWFIRPDGPAMLKGPIATAPKSGRMKKLTRAKSGSQRRSHETAVSSRRRFVGFLLMTSLVGCVRRESSLTTTNQSAIEASKPDPKSWLSPHGESSNISPGIPQTALILIVPDETREYAVDQLRNTPIVALSDSELIRLVPANKPPAGYGVVENAIAHAATQVRLSDPAPAGVGIEYARANFGKLQPYLVRGVSPNGGGVFQVGMLGDEVRVFCGGLGPSRYEMRPLIVFLEQKPTRIWVGTASAL
jgi:hypothetical protein